MTESEANQCNEKTLHIFIVFVKLLRFDFEEAPGKI
jgi:hypothetical protein